MVDLQTDLTGTQSFLTKEQALVHELRLAIQEKDTATSGAIHDANAETNILSEQLQRTQARISDLETENLLLAQKSEILHQQELEDLKLRLVEAEANAENAPLKLKTMLERSRIGQLVRF